MWLVRKLTRCGQKQRIRPLLQTEESILEFSLRNLFWMPPSHPPVRCSMSTWHTHTPHSTESLEQNQCITFQKIVQNHGIFRISSQSLVASNLELSQFNQHQVSAIARMYRQLARRVRFQYLVLSVIVSQPAFRLFVPTLRCRVTLHACFYTLPPIKIGVFFYCSFTVATFPPTLSPCCLGLFSPLTVLYCFLPGMVLSLQI